MKVIFLDIDGVLNSLEYRKRLGMGYFSEIIDPRKMPLLKQIVEATGANIVLSSTWRKFWQNTGPQTDPAMIRVETLLREYGLSVYSKTPVMEDADRSREIETWLRQHPLWDGYVILDDKDFGWPASLKAHFIQTDLHRDGLEASQVQEVIDVLNGNLLPVPVSENKHSFKGWLKRFRSK